MLHINAAKHEIRSSRIALKTSVELKEKRKVLFQT